ncbi:hypothetical protein QG37_01603 [Candidozyma auris]|uniref:Uncharacterized protein n=1 Tax=Candidozyma auris TaxID=498019 RepID=A0A0L0P4J5_CANAR|nr:hypothetical protein QG37_01603 [[Candida] auris]
MENAVDKGKRGDERLGKEIDLLLKLAMSSVFLWSSFSSFFWEPRTVTFSLWFFAAIEILRF